MISRHQSYTPTSHFDAARWDLRSFPLRAGSPLYVNPVNVLSTLTKVLAEGKGGIVRFCLKAEQSGEVSETNVQPGVQSYEPTNRNSIQGQVSG
ncbi:MAG: hypothetical protein LWX51_14335 [Deltaproteobacteria bacterium]|nr:hypothetical protein [Deltaproteobacteria bacterium]